MLINKDSGLFLWKHGSNTGFDWKKRCLDCRGLPLNHGFLQTYMGTSCENAS